MTLQGRGLLAIWNGIARGRDADFVEWHVREHMRERVGLPGFISGRRYTAIEAHPAYFNFYEVETPAVLLSPEYLARLNDPTPWTRDVVADFTDTARTVCRVAETTGCGIAGLAEVLWFDAPPAADAAPFVASLARQRGVVAAHLAVAEGAAGTQTAEHRLRGGPDREWSAVLIVEMVMQSARAALADGPLSPAALAAAGLGGLAGRGFYALDFALTRADVTSGAA